MNAADLRPPLDVIFAAFAMPATVTPLGGSPTPASVTWEGVDTQLRIRSAYLLGAGDLSDLRPKVAIRRVEVSSLPIGSTIEGADHAGGTVKTWRVDEVYDTDPEIFRAVVH